MLHAFPAPIVSAEWLKSNLNAPDLVVLDASWHMPAAGRNARTEFETAHIPGARFFDLDEHSDHTTDLPHMLATAEAFAAAVGAMGIRNDTRVVVYDSVGLFSAARLWWNFRVMGHDHVAVLDGGFPAWQRAGGELETGAAKIAPAKNFTAQFRRELVRSKTELLQNVQNHGAQVLDARGAERFEGRAAEPRPGVRSGHIPGSHNVHYASLLATDGTLKQKSELEQIFMHAGVTPNQPVIASCGSGVTACIIDLALEQTGHRNHAVYDGSWAEWGAANDTPVETGKQSGFTLVELAIVLVIVGLIIGGVLAGATLIRNAEIRALVNERNKIETAVNTFRVKYNALPGDMPNATAIWGAADTDPANCVMTDSGDKRTCNGNGNKRIFPVQNLATNEDSELYRFWQHLSNAELVNGTFSGVPGPDGVWHAIPGENVMASRVDGGAWMAEYVGNMDAVEVAASPHMYQSNYQQLLIVGALLEVPGMGALPVAPLITSAEVYALDLKIDDGKPGSGQLLTFAPGVGTPFENTCTTSGDYKTAEYNVDEGDHKCTLMFKVKL